MTNYAPLLDFISRGESKADYDAIWGGIKKADYPKKALTLMTIREVLAWQDSIDAKYRSEAAGRYQILEDTLRANYAKAGLTLDDFYNRTNQDKLAIRLMVNRGLKGYLEGRMSAEDFANALCLEWASLRFVSGPKKGKGAYDGDGLNKGLADGARLLELVRGLRGASEAKPSVPQPEARTGFLEALRAALAPLFDLLSRLANAKPRGKP